MRVIKETLVTRGSRVKRVLIRAMSKWTKQIVTFNEEEDEDTLVEEGPQIERGTELLRDTYRHVGFCQKHISDKRLPREAFSYQGDVEVTKDIVTFNEEEDEDTLVEEGPLIETRHGVSRGHRPPLDSPEKHVDKRVPCEA